jgi:hypothetical protein
MGHEAAQEFPYLRKVVGVSVSVAAQHLLEPRHALALFLHEAANVPLELAESFVEVLCAVVRVSGP